jgi:hypothetical protein
MMMLFVLFVMFILITLCFFLYRYLSSFQKNNVFVDAHFHQAQHHYEGKADVIQPNAIDSLSGFLKSYKEGNEDGLLHIIQLYLYGLHPDYGPDKLTGLKLMKKIQSDDHFSNRLKQVCKMFEEDTSVMIYTDIDSYNSEYKILPTTILDIVDDIIHHQLQNKIDIVSCSMNVSHKTKPRQVATTYEDVMFDIANIDYGVGDDGANHTDFDMIIHNDSQNVHNHSVQNISKNIIASLDNNINSFDDNSLSFLGELKKHTQSISKIEVAKIMMVINSMSDTIHSKYNKSEKDVFNLTFERIMNKKDSEEKMNLFIMFAQNIASAVEYDVVVCSTGKITRMLSSFDVIDSELPDLKPDWVIREEIGRTAARIRTEVMKESDEVTKADDVISSNMKSRLLDECHETYVKTNIMSETALNIILIDYLEAF